MTEQTENTTAETSDLMEKISEEQEVSVTGHVGSGHVGIDHIDVIKMYIGTHPETYKNEVGVPWGYRKIANFYKCSVQNIRRHVKSEADKLGLTVDELKTQEGVIKFTQSFITKDKDLIRYKDLVSQLAEALELPEAEIEQVMVQAFSDEADIVQLLKDAFGNRYKTVRSMIIGIAMPGVKKNADDETFRQKFSYIVEDNKDEDDEE